MKYLRPLFLLIFSFIVIAGNAGCGSGGGQRGELLPGVAESQIVLKGTALLPVSTVQTGRISGRSSERFDLRCYRASRKALQY